MYSDWLSGFTWKVLLKIQISEYNSNTQPGLTIADLGHSQLSWPLLMFFAFPYIDSSGTKICSSVFWILQGLKHGRIL